MREGVRQGRLEGGGGGGEGADDPEVRGEFGGEVAVYLVKGVLLVAGWAVVEIWLAHFLVLARVFWQGRSWT